RDLTKIFTNTEYAAWRSLRESEDAPEEVFESLRRC
ncbi:PF05943 domain protein, partial [Bordetella bronchiseptica F4563]